MSRQSICQNVKTKSNFVLINKVLLFRNFGITNVILPQFREEHMFFHSDKNYICNFQGSFLCFRLIVTPLGIVDTGKCFSPFLYWITISICEQKMFKCWRVVLNLNWLAKVLISTLTDEAQTCSSPARDKQEAKSCDWKLALFANGANNIKMENWSIRWLHFLVHSNGQHSSENL